MENTRKRQPTKKQMEQVDSYLLYHLPGYRWMTANPNLFDEIENMDALQAFRIACKSFRYFHLNKVVSGNWASEGAKQQRRERWIADIKRQARTISLDTNISYNKVFHILFNRMFEELTK